MSTPVLLRTYPDQIHADLARSFLDSEGIDATVEVPENSAPVDIFAEWGMGAVPHGLFVAQEDYDRADALLKETESVKFEED